MTSSLTRDTAAWAAYQSARDTLHEREKALSKHKDAVTEQRRQLPWLKLDKTYKLQGEEGEVTLASLFGSQKQLLVYNMMSFDEVDSGDEKPGEKHGHCDKCLHYVHQFNTIAPALRKLGAVAVICRGPLPYLLAIKKQQGWTVPIYSCQLDFTTDIGTEDHPKAARYGHRYKIASRPGLSAFHLGRADGSDPQSIFLTYSTADRGVEEVDGYVAWLDRIPDLGTTMRMPGDLEWDKRAVAQQMKEAGTCC